ncbi:MAG TPA: hypothetical protein DCM87_05360 [Planctomycetes bacterium]|nr:hypothetical protein [Planctomycetota bacterium]
MPSERLENLMRRHFDADLNAEEIRELDAALSSDPAAARRLVELADEHLALSAALGRPVPAFDPATAPPRAFFSAPRVAAAAAAAVLAFALWHVFTPGPPRAPSYDGESLFKLSAGGALEPAASVALGTRYLARAGVLHLSSAEIAIKAPAVFSLSEAARGARQPIALAAGHVAVKTRGRGGIEIETGQGTLRDIGTEFEVRVGRPMEEEEMLRKIKAGTLPTFVAATVLTGLVQWSSQAGEDKVLSPAMGAVNLAFDASAGTILDREGIALVRPLGGERWTLLRERMQVMPGDWIKTGGRGGNAVEIELRDATRLTLGPGGLLEIAEKGGLRLHAGDLAVAPAAGAACTVEGPGGVSKEVAAAAFLGLRQGALAALGEEPRWHALYRAKSPAEAMGELVASIDGRDVPLTLGYHKVTVDIRDQIARTVVEESFVNHTDATLEGQFYFPLPQEASISGFAMWIGNELVEADIVEKERAREIFEEIVREKRDPALLEWTGGNIFKARVFPIPAHGEKRIRITYTQVLPKQGRTYRYAYALKSELLRKTPLRELRIEVTIDSAEELAKVACTSHMTRAQTTAHAASIEFAAQEYTPDRDFEVLVTTAPAPSPLRVIPHLRGKDGYFMAFLQAEDEGGGRPLVRDTAPLDILCIADTSGSMTDDQLRTQRAFIACLLESLGAKDTFNIAAFDTTVVWAFSTRMPATAENRDAALAFLDRRSGLGWTDLDLAFKEALAQAHAGTQVIYVGDGIPTAGDADPVAFAARLKALHKGEGALHAIGVGSTYESMVLKAIASLGRGSFHRAGDSAEAARVAAALLAEITAPGLRDAAVRWEGFRTAAVYPEELPNLPAGSQQIILGRYLPEGGDLAGKAVLTAVAGGEKTAREIEVSLKGAEEGNAFIPRLWARMHLDHLLSQGRSPEVKDAIIALSESYQIITPYTSFLVLESDADRERFKVTKRLRMRDAEEFFAESRERADFALAREHMLKAALWRKGIRKAVLDLYATLGYGLIAPRRGTSYGVEHAAQVYGRLGEWNRSAGMNGTFGTPLELREKSAWYEESDGRRGVLGGDAYGDFIISDGDILAGDIDGRAPSFGTDAPLDLAMKYDGERFAAGDEFLDFESAPTVASQLVAGPVAAAEPVDMVEYMGRASVAKRAFFSESELPGLAYGGRPRARRAPPPFAALFPSVHAVPAPFKTAWPAEIRELVAKLDRRSVLAAREGGLRIDVEQDSLDARGAAVPGRRATFVLGKDAWVARTQNYPGALVTLRWSVAGESGACDVSRLLAATRKAEPGDGVAYEAPFDRWFDDLERQFASYKPALAAEDGKAVLTLTPRRGRGGIVRVTIDLERPAILEIAGFDKDAKVWSQTFADFADAGGLLWPQRIEWRGKDGKVNSACRIRYAAFADAALPEALAKERAALAQAITLDLPLAKVVDAKTRVLEKKAGLSDLWQLMLHAAETQQWETVAERFEAFAALAAGKPGLDWIQIEVLKAARRNEEAKAEVARLAAAIEGASREANAAESGCYGLATALLDGQREILQPLEQIVLLDALKPVFERQDERLTPMREWTRRRIECLDRLGRAEEAFALKKELAARHPYAAYLQTQYADALAYRGEVDAAVEHLEACVRATADLTEDEILTLRHKASELLYEAHKLVEYLAYAGAHFIGSRSNVRDDVFDRYLAALVLLDRVGEADALIAKWIEGGRAEEPDPVEAARLAAALRHALGQGRDLWSNRIDPKWVPALLGVARAFALREERSYLAGQVLNHWRFKQLDVFREISGELYNAMTRGVASLPPAVLANVFGWTRSYEPKEGETARAAFLQAVFARWERETGEDAQASLANILSSCGDAELAIALGRAQIARAAGPEAKAAAAGRLFNLLLGRPWSAELEKELASLIAQVGFGEQAIPAKIGAVQAYARYLVDARTRALVEAIPDRHAKSRRELAPLAAEAAKTARTEAVGKLAALGAAGLGSEIAPYIAIERLSIEAKLGLEPARVFDELASLFNALPELVEDAPLVAFVNVLGERCLLVLGYLTAAPEADPALAEKLGALLDAAIAAKTARADARLAKYRLLVALDRGDALEDALGKWAEEDGAIAGNRWRVPYGYILAERGKLEAAVKVFEGVRAIDALRPAEYRALAGWCMALDSPDRRREALVRSHMATGEWQLNNTLRQELGRYRRSGDRIPDAMGEDVFIRFAALLRKTSQPGRHLGLLREYYEVTKDFKLLETLSEVVIGQTAVKVYDALGELDRLAALIGDEATIDRFERHLRELRADAKTEVDRRALALIEFMIEFRAAAQSQGGEPHGARALAALREAFKEKWQEGEEPLMARFLASTGRLVEPLRSEALGQLEALHAAAASGSQARFEIGAQRAASLWANDAKEEAAGVLAAALDEYRAASEGRLPAHAHGGVSNLSSFFEDLGRLVAAEKLWRGELGRAYNDQELHGFRNGMYGFYARAIERKGTTALGAGETLYRAVHGQLVAEIERLPSEWQARDLVARLCEVFAQARKAGIASAPKDLREYAYKGLPAVLTRHQYREGQSMVANVASEIRDALGPREAVEFLVVRAENEPAWLERRNEGFWNRHERVAVWRHEAGDIGSVEPRLLALVLAELDRALDERDFRARAFYYHYNAHFWKEKAGDFFRTALAVLERRRDSEESVKFIAGYLMDGLQKHDAAIDALAAAHRRGILGEEGRAQLVSYLQGQGRHAESLALLEGPGGMIEKWPDNVDYRAFLIIGRHGAGRQEDAAAARAAADAHFRADNRWNEHAAAQLASACMTAELFEHAAGYYTEAMTFRRTANPLRRGGDGRLSDYYRSQAEAYVRLGRTAEAVDAAAGAIVVWARDINQRNGAVENLRRILAKAGDLAEYAAAFDRECADQKIEKPAIRKALGRVFLDKRDFAAAALHLEAGMESGSFDAEVFRMLVQAYDGQGASAKGTARLLALARRSGHAFELYKELGERMRREGDQSGAERALTTLAEMSANESEGRALLAQVRENDRRFAEAAAEWRHVVRIRSKEPAGYLGLGRCLLHAGQGEEARKVLEDFLGEDWHPRFGDVKAQARELMRRLEK